MPMVKKIEYFSNGCAAQYKNYQNFLNLTLHHQDFGYKASWTIINTAFHYSSLIDFNIFQINKLNSCSWVKLPKIAILCLQQPKLKFIVCYLSYISLKSTSNTYTHTRTHRKTNISATSCNSHDHRNNSLLLPTRKLLRRDHSTIDHDPTSMLQKSQQFHWT